MRRLLILVSWLILIGAIGVVVTVFGLVSSLAGLSEIGSLLGVAGGLGAVLITMLSDQERIGNWIVKGPFNRSARRLRRKSTSGFEVANQRTLMASVIAATETDSDLPGNVLAEAIAGFGDHPGGVVTPSDLRSYRNWLHGAVRSSKDSALNRLLVPSRSAAVAAIAERVVDGLDQFLHHEVVKARELTRVAVVRGKGEPDDGIRFSDFVTAFTGALVLVDAAQTRSGSPASLKVWHDRSYRPASDGARHYSDLHAHDPSIEPVENGCRWGEAMRNETRSRADDYDGRVLDLKAVSLVRDRRNGFVEIVMMTDETCYAATEVSPWACKGLGIDDDDGTTPRWEIDESAADARRVESPRSKLTIVTAFAAIILETTGAKGIEHTLVLSQRASGVRNGGDVISITGGGVLNLSVEGKPGDEDPDGFPDPTGTVIRELGEELGLSLNREDVVPVSAHILNQRGPHTTARSVTTGQLVATASFAVHLPMTMSELRAQRVHASSHSGLYESTDLVEFPMSTMGGSGEGDTGRLRAATEFARSLKDRSGEIDQQSMIAALYASAAQYTIPVTVRAFAEVWGKPWYVDPWSPRLEANSTEHDRLARPLDRQLDRVSMERIREVEARLWS